PIFEACAGFFCSSSGSGATVKCGGKKLRFPPRGVFVVVVVVVTDKEYGGNERRWGRGAAFSVLFEREMAALAALAAVALAVECQEVTSYQ
ncbi:MAG: hypothetical protein J0L63_17340, partial [Anaerolineae bacterium]|nr:hypothetical protein [Anaerolineae bacterium]